MVVPVVTPVVAPATGGAVEAADADLAQVQPGSELGDGGVHQAVDVGGGFQPLAQVGEDLVGLVPAAVDDAGDGALQRFAERNQQQRGGGGRERGGPPGVMIGRERDGGDHQDGVDADDGAGHGQPQQRAVRGAAQVVEPVAEDRDRDRDGQREQHHAEDPAGNAGAVGEYDSDKDHRRRAGGQREKQQLLADQRPTAPPPRDESGDGPGGGGRGEQDPGGAEGVGDAAVAAGQSERALPVGEPGLVRGRAENVAEEQAGHRRGGGPGQPAPARTGQVAVREDDRYADHGDQQPRRLQTGPDGGHISGAGDRARGGDHAVNAGLSQRCAGSHDSSGGQQQPTDTVTGHREGDHRTDHSDRPNGESERQRAGEGRGASPVIGGGDGRAGKGDHDGDDGRGRGDTAADQRRRRAVHRLMVHHVCVSGENHLPRRDGWSGRGPVPQAAGQHRDGADQPGQ